MAFNDLQMKVTSEFALQALHAKLEAVTDFAHNFRDLEDRKGASIVVPTFELSGAGIFDATTNNYFSGVNEIGGATVPLSCHYVKSLAITDRDIAETEVQFNRDGGMAIGDALGRALYNGVISLLNDDNVTLSTESSLSSDDDFAGLVATTYEKELDIDEAVLLLDPVYYAKALGLMKAYTYGGPEAVRGGRIPGLYGFKSVVCAPGLAAGWKGAIVDRNSIAVAARYLAPMPGAYVGAWKATDPINGLTIGFREGTDLASGVRYLAGEVLFGRELIRPKGVVSIK